MEILRSHHGVAAELRNGVLAIGNFDGVHRGHQAVLQAAKDAARAAGRLAGVMVFEPHPRQFFAPDKPLFRLTSLDRKLKLFEAFGLDLAIVLTFDKELAGRTAEDFVSTILVEGFGISHAVLGYDFCFGKGRKGTPETMRCLGKTHNFEVTVVAPAGDGDDVFSSSRIRDLLRHGDVRGAAKLLGYWWGLSGPVEGGAGRGTGLGFPTANLRVPGSVQLMHGIYAARVHAGGQIYRAAAYFGTRPTFEEGEAVLEAFLLDFEGDLYGQEILIELIDFLRGDQKFHSVEALKAQVAADCARAARVLDELNDGDPLVTSPLAALSTAQIS
ncbi:MAG: bifunctional riboflavin kinase/FAD synthetase [Methyloligellaceae bacterium]